LATEAKFHSNITAVTSLVPGGAADAGVAGAIRAAEVAASAVAVTDHLDITGVTPCDDGQASLPGAGVTVPPRKVYSKRVESHSKYFHPQP
jgi:hypothetical protein